MAELRDLLTARDVAKLLKLSRSTVYRLRRKGDLPGIRVGRSVRFDLQDVVDWLERNRDQKK